MNKESFSFYVEGMTDDEFSAFASMRFNAKEHPEYWNAPYFYDGITLGELEEEQRYYAKYYEEYKQGNYIPLWKQKLELIQKEQYKNSVFSQFLRQNIASLF